MNWERPDFVEHECNLHSFWGGASLCTLISETSFEVPADPVEQYVCTWNTHAISTFQEVGGGSHSTASPERQTYLEI